MRILLLLSLLISLLFASIKDLDSKIDKNKQQINYVKLKKNNLNKNINILADTINKEEKAYENVVSILRSTNTKLLLNRLRLSNSISKINELTAKSKKLQAFQLKMEQDVVDFVIEKYAMGMGIEQVNKNHINDIISKEIYNLVFENAKKEMSSLNIQYSKINNFITVNENKIEILNTYIKKQNVIQIKYLDLVNIQEKTLKSLKKKHKNYQKNLATLINKQNKITDLLGSLNILKKKEIKNEELRIKKAQRLARKKQKQRKERENALAQKSKKSQEIKIKKRNNFDDNINIEVRKIGSSAKGVKVSKYNGRTTIAPLRAYKITKRFGKYYDAVYKMELFNESVAMQTKIPNAKVFSVFKGQVVYAKQNSGLLENVVIIKHKNNLHTIYSHLDQIAPTLKTGKWIPKGYIVGRISDTLEFQATANSKYIDPLQLIKGVK